MTCKPHVGPDGTVTGWSCSRSSGRRFVCEVCGKATVANLAGMKLCDFPLRGAKAGVTCDRKMCGGCAVHVGPDRDYCPPHARLANTERSENKGG